MIALLSRWRGKPRPKPVIPRRARLELEALESRYCPSPVLSLSAQALPGHVAQLRGMLSDSNPAGATITFSGAVTGSTTTDCRGRYCFSTTSASLGTISAVGVDKQGFTSNTAQALLTVPAPSLTLSLRYGSKTTVTLYGSVTDLDQSRLTVTFSGVASGSVSTNADGTFSFTTTASGLGTIQASTVNLWGLASNVASVAITDTAPQIVGFTAVEGSLHMWTFSGTVTDESPAGLTVTFGGIPSLLNETATVQKDGSFSLTVQLSPGEGGMATAQVTDWWNLSSAVVMVLVNQT